jgi:ABC-type uncharacterized transport system substrate-binding protein
VPFWCSIRVALTFLGFLGMIVHFTQKTNISIGVVCMVNHSAIEHNRPSSTNTLIDDGCSQTNHTKDIVNKKNNILTFTTVHYRMVLLFGQKIFKVSS